jgi:hypothetical protein
MGCLCALARTRRTRYIHHTVVPEVKVNVTLEQATMAQRGSTGIALLFFLNLGARYEWVVNATPRPL